MIKTLDTNCRRTCATRRGGKVLAYNFKQWMIRTPVTAPLLKMRLFAATAGVRIRECLVEKKSKQTNVHKVLQHILESIYFISSYISVFI